VAFAAATVDGNVQIGRRQTCTHTSWWHSTAATQPSAR
jgi:hypothetical protein